MSDFSIHSLEQHSEHIPIIAHWHQQEWKNISPELTTEKRIQLYSGYEPAPALPCCLVATQGPIPLGSISLVTSDMDTRPQLGPWVASLYVDAPYRRRGIASRLLQHIIQVASTLNITRIYLFTPDQAMFYRKRGWQHLESCEYHGEDVDIMYYDIEGAEL